MLIKKIGDMHLFYIFFVNCTTKEYLGFILMFYSTKNIWFFCLEKYKKLYLFLKLISSNYTIIKSLVYSLIYIIINNGSISLLYF